MKFIVESTFVIAAIVVFGFVWGSPGIWDSPQVHVSNSSNECVKVINYSKSDEYTCDNLPELYSHVWVR